MIAVSRFTIGEVGAREHRRDRVEHVRRVGAELLGEGGRIGTGHARLGVPLGRELHVAAEREGDRSAAPPWTAGVVRSHWPRWLRARRRRGAVVATSPSTALVWLFAVVAHRQVQRRADHQRARPTGRSGCGAPGNGTAASVRGGRAGTGRSSPPVPSRSVTNRRARPSSSSAVRSNARCGPPIGSTTLSLVVGAEQLRRSGAHGVHPPPRRRPISSDRRGPDVLTPADELLQGERPRPGAGDRGPRSGGRGCVPSRSRDRQRRPSPASACGSRGPRGRCPTRASASCDAVRGAVTALGGIRRSRSSTDIPAWANARSQQRPGHGRAALIGRAEDEDVGAHQRASAPERCSGAEVRRTQEDSGVRR